MHAHSVFLAGEDSSEDFKIDLMDYIFEELFSAVMNRKCPPYARYLMKLIYETVKDQGNLLENAECIGYYCEESFSP